MVKKKQAEAVERLAYKIGIQNDLYAIIDKTDGLVWYEEDEIVDEIFNELGLAFDYKGGTEYIICSSNDEKEEVY